jgi:UDP-glucose 4-epimerase
MTRAVVTGGAGFIGSNLAHELSARDYQVVIFDNLATGRKENIEQLLKRDNVDFIQGSITDLPTLVEAFSGATYVFHQAAIPSVPRSVEYPLASHEANVDGTLKVLLAARDCKVKKLVYASSSSVYGDTPTLPKKEDMAPNPQSPYAVSKLAGEYYCRVFQSVYGLPTVCLRYFNVYGPKQDPNSNYAAAIPRFITSVLRGEPPVIFGDGEQTRDFTYVKDVVAANILAAEGGAAGVANVASARSISVNDLARSIIKLIGNKVEPVYREPRAGEVKHSLADIRRAAAFGFQPEYDLAKGLRETIEHLRATRID